jgi:hypothetical protein
MLRLLETEKKAEFDELVAQGTPAQRAALRFRMRPYGMSSPFDVYGTVTQYNLKEVAGGIRFPMLITDPEGEQFWPGQSQGLYNMLKCPKRLVRFTAAEGADLHCELKDPGLRDLRVFNWLDEVLGR